MENDLYSELQKKTAQLDYSIRELRKNGTAYAESEKAYKVLLRTEVLELRDEGTAVGVIEKSLMAYLRSPKRDSSETCARWFTKPTSKLSRASNCR